VGDGLGTSQQYFSNTKQHGGNSSMARSLRDSRLETRTARLRLERGKLYWLQLDDGLSLVYRRNADGAGTWSIRVNDTAIGKRSMRAIGKADDFQDADGYGILSFAQAQKRGFELHAKPTPSTITVAQAAEKYLEWYRQHRKAYKETLATIEAHILPDLGDKAIVNLSSRDIKEWHTKLATRPARKRTKRGLEQAYKEHPITHDEKRARKSTANRILTVLKAILNKAFEDELVADDTPWRRVKPFNNVDEPVIRFLTEAESTRLINACRPDFRQLVKAALFTGSRYSELARLRVTDINLDTGLVFLSAEAKSGKGRYVPLSEEGLSFFAEVIAGKTGDELAFTKLDGTPWSRSHQLRPMTEACEAARIRPMISFHELRHTYASLLAQAGADLLTISKLLGHADTRITSRHYAHLCDKTLANTVRTLLPSFGHKADKKVKAVR
jgi:integrase